MIRAVIVALVLAVTAGCNAAPRMIRQTQDDDGHRIVAISVPLCEMCSTPYDSQLVEAGKMMRDRCRGPYDVIEEGTASKSSGAYAMPVAGMLVAGTTTTSSYYWVARCDR